jgi:hypothetical protein
MAFIGGAQPNSRPVLYTSYEDRGDHQHDERFRQIAVMISDPRSVQGKRRKDRQDYEEKRPRIA